MIAIRWRRKRVLACAVLLAAVLISLIYIIAVINNIIKDMHCSEEASKHILDEMCRKFDAREVDGNLCEDLCHTGRVHYNTCLNRRRGKKVMIMECRDSCIAGATVRTVLKSEHDWDQIHFISLDSDGNRHSLPQQVIKEAVGLINESIFSNFGIVLGEKDFFSNVWFSGWEEFMLKSSYQFADRAAILSIWGLLQQDEYMFMKLHQDVSFVPLLYGSCGSLFLMEYTPPGNILDPRIMQIDSSTWEQRVRIALSLLDVVWALDTEAKYPLHLCDVKEENFGINKDGVVKIIDTDTLFYEEKLESILGSQNCTSDRQCDFWDCRGLCERKIAKCQHKRSNNNLQSVCEKILSGSLPRLSAGLLRDPPRGIWRELEETLNVCTFPQYEQGNMGNFGRAPAQKIVYWKLYKLLQKSV
ncbi:hypothetical protein ScPMuIL_001803 [Solemya velum]